MTNTRAIYVNCYESYRQGHDHGVWVDLEKHHTRKDVLTVIDSMLRVSPAKDAESWEITDWVGIPDDMSSLSNIISYNEALVWGANPVALDELREHLIGRGFEPHDLIEYYKCLFQGEWPSIEDFAEHCFDRQIEGLPSAVRNAICWSNVAEQMSLEAAHNTPDKVLFWCTDYESGHTLVFYGTIAHLNDC